MITKPDYRDVIARHYNKLGKRKKVLADKILSTPLEVIGMSIGALAECCGCDQTTIVRFAQQLGYSGYPELKLAIARKADILWKDSAGSPAADHRSLYAKITRIHEESIRKTLLQIPEDVLHHAAARIEGSEHVMICGSGSSALAAEDLSIKLMRLGVKTLFFRDQEMWRTFAGTLGGNDTLIVFSNFGETPGVIQLMKTVRENGVKCIGITSVTGSTVHTLSDIHLHTNDGGELPIRLGAMGSRTSQMIVSDLLTMVFSQRDKERSWQRLEATYVTYCDNK